MLRIKSFDMEDLLKNFSDIDNCPIRNVVSRFGSKWPMLVLLLLDVLGTARFSDVMKYLPDISSKVLSKELKTLEADNLIHRQAYAEVPPRVEYTLTERGMSLVPLLWALVEWAKKNMTPIERSREKYSTI